MSDDLIWKFRELFFSRESATTFATPDADPTRWTYRTEPRAFTDGDVNRHLAGERSIVAIPILRDNTCRWGAIDIDGAEHRGVTELEFERLREEGGNRGLLVDRSKSRGAHLFLLLDQAIPARLLRRHLHALAVEFGYPGAEVFPKQDELTVDGKGNGVNLPFFGRSFELHKFQPRRVHVPASAGEQVQEHVLAKAMENDG